MVKGAVNKCVENKRLTLYIRRKWLKTMQNALLSCIVIFVAENLIDMFPWYYIHSDIFSYRVLPDFNLLGTEFFYNKYRVICQCPFLQYFPVILKRTLQNYWKILEDIFHWYCMVIDVITIVTSINTVSNSENGY